MGSKRSARKDAITGSDGARVRIGRRSVVLLIASGILLGAPAHATVIGGESSAYGLRVDLVETVTTLGESTVTERSLFGPFVSVTAPAPDVETMAQQLTSGLPTIGLSTDTIAVVAASDVDGSPGERTAQAAAAGTIVLYLANVTWFAATISFSSSAEESGDAGAFSDASLVELAGSDLTIGNVPTPLPDNPTPNMVVHDANGLRAVAWEVDFESSDSGEWIGVDALHLYLDDFVVFEDSLQRISFSGEIVFGHTEARLTAVPEPSTLALALVGAAAVAGVKQRARR